MELKVATLIKEGKTTKEVAGLLRTSIRSVEYHRGNIREKLGFKGKQINLQSYPTSLG